MEGLNFSYNIFALPNRLNINVQNFKIVFYLPDFAWYWKRVMNNAVRERLLQSFDTSIAHLGFTEAQVLKRG